MKLTTADLKRYRRLKYAAPGKDPPPSSETVPRSDETAPPPELDPRVVERNREVLALIEEFIAQLPDEFTRDVVLLKYARGLKWHEVAQRIGGTTGESLMQYVYYQIKIFNNKRNEG